MTKNKTRNNTNKNFHSSGLRQKVDQLMDILYAGGVNNPMDSIEQISYLLFLRLLTERDEQLATLSKKYKRIFSGKWARYAWGNFVTLTGDQLFDSTRSAIENLHELPDLSDTGRLLFRRATLKIYDRPTLRAVIQSIHEMDLIGHDGADIKGDMYEYLLSKISMSGTNGQFRTPRHIIDFIVEMVDPKPGQRICDPACGTAGFLISAFNYILKQNTSKADLKTCNVTGDKLKPAQWKFLEQQAFTGFDNDANMIKIAILNLYLHKLEKANIDLHNPLTTTRGGTYPGPQYDCILANPPFSGKVQKESILSDLNHGINTRATELLFLKWFIDHLADKGRAGVIVPEGVMYVDKKAYEKLRQVLVQNNFLYAVVAMPSGIFKPYASVKTNILFIDKNIAKKSNGVLFVEVKNDGFSLGDSRKPLDENDLPEAEDIIRQFKQSVVSGQSIKAIERENPRAYVISKSRIREGRKHHLIGRWFKIDDEYEGVKKYPLKSLEDLCHICKGKSPNMKTLPGEYPLVVPAEKRKTADHFDFERAATCIPLISSSGHGKADIKRLHYQEGRFALADTMCCLIPKNINRLHPKFLYKVLDYKKDKILVPLMRGAANVSMSTEQLKYLKIPMPPLEVQKKIVECDRYIKVVDQAIKLADKLEPSTESVEKQLYEVNKYLIDLYQIRIKKTITIAEIWGFDTSQATVEKKADETAYSGLLIAEVAERYRTDASVACLVLQHFKERVKPIREFHLQKYVYITQQYLKLPIVSEFQPMAAGPWSSAFKDYACAYGRQQQWFFLKGRNVEPGKALKEGTAEAEKILGRQRGKVLRLLDDLKRFGDSGLERWSTILMVVSQLKAARKAVTRRNIQEAIDNWSGKRNKEWFTKITVSKAIDGMNQKGWIKLIGE